jgi:hypothetical protein
VVLLLAIKVRLRLQHLLADIHPELRHRRAGRAQGMVEHGLIMQLPRQNGLAFRREPLPGPLEDGHRLVTRPHRLAPSRQACGSGG